MRGKIFRNVLLFFPHFFLKDNIFPKKIPQMLIYPVPDFLSFGILYIFPHL